MRKHCLSSHIQINGRLLLLFGVLIFLACGSARAAEPVRIGLT